MDKLRAVMQTLWVQRFWVLSVVGVIAAVVCWMMAAGTLQDQYQAEKSEILGKFTDMQTIASKPFHGNEVINAKEREEASKIAESVEVLWKRLFDHQREKVLFWPDVLGQDFLEYIEKRKFDAPIPNALRDRYLNYIEKQFDYLVSIVDAQELDESGSAMFGEGGRGAVPFTPEMGAGVPGADMDYLVQWLDQSTLRQKLQFGRRPTAREVWVRQEDLWVYETLLRVIAATNKERNATRPDNTAIRVIEALQVGAEAATASTQPANILMPAGAAGDPAAYSGEAMAGGELGAEMYGRGGMEGYGEFGGAADPAAADAQLLAGRYIDDAGAPIADGTTGAGVEFRRLPVFLRLQMDPRWIPQVLIQCANAPLPIEVKRLRINPEKAAEGFDMSGGMGGEGGRGGPMMGRGFAVEGGFSAMAAGAPAADMVTLELHGVVYIYNPPDPTILTVPGAEDLAAADTAIVR